MKKIYKTILFALLNFMCLVSWANEASTYGDSDANRKHPAASLAENQGIPPFGANLFTGNFSKTRHTGINPDYLIMPGDKVAVYTWGTVLIDNVFTVDGQGNIFLPEIGPVQLEGVTNENLTKAVDKAIRRVYTRNFGVYTNLLTANPVAIFVTGGVKKPGRYAGLPSDSILYFLDQADGIDPILGSYRNIILIRNSQEIARLDLYNFLIEGKIDIPQLKDNDAIVVQRRGPTVELSGDIAAHSMVELLPDENLGQDALKIIPQAANATAVTITGIRNQLPFSQTLNILDFMSFNLENGDTIILRSDGRPGTILIKIQGEHDSPQILAINRGTRLIDLLNYIRVNPELANTKAVHLRRLSVAKAQKDSIDDALFRLERSALLALSSSRGEAEIRVKEAELTAQFVERARHIQPLGRVVTAQQGNQLNITLEEGDAIIIPQKTNVIRIGGEVMISQAVIHHPGLIARDYIKMAGGYSERGDEGKVIIMHADASITVGNPNVKIQPGDEILIPPKIDTKVLQNATDVMQIIYQVAMSAGVVLAL